MLSFRKHTQTDGANHENLSGPLWTTAVTTRDDRSGAEVPCPQALRIAKFVPKTNYNFQQSTMLVVPASAANSLESLPDAVRVDMQRHQELNAFSDGDRTPRPAGHWQAGK